MLEVLGEDYVRTARSQGHPREPRDHPARAPLGHDPGGHPVRHRRGGPRRRRRRRPSTVFSLPGLGKTTIDAINHRTSPSSSGSCSWPRSRSWCPTSWSTCSMPSSTRASACTDRFPLCGVAPLGLLLANACQNGEVHPSPAPAPALDGHDRQTTLQVLPPRLRARRGRLLHRVAETARFRQPRRTLPERSVELTRLNAALADLRGQLGQQFAGHGRPEEEHSGAGQRSHRPR